MNEQFSELGTKTTKEVLLQYYNAARNHIVGNGGQTSLNAQEIAKEREKNDALGTAKTAQDTPTLISALRASLMAQLATLEMQYKEAIDDYTRLQSAVTFRSMDLEEIYGIENKAGALASLIEAHQNKETEFELKRKQDTEVLEQNLRERRARFDMEMVQQRQAWEREKEVYLYSWTRDKERKELELVDAREAQDRKMQEEYEAHARKMSDYTIELNKRSALLDEREQHLEELQQEISTFPQRLEDAAKNAQKEAFGIAKERAENQAKLIEAQHSSKVSVLEAQVKGQQSQIEEYRKIIEELRSELKAATSEIKGLAGEALKASSGRELSNKMEAVLNEAIKSQKQGDKK